MSEFALVPITFFTSLLAGVMGMGGGILLITLMAGLVPASAIIPLHAATQLASNVSRAAFGARYIDWGIVPAFVLGAIAGAWFGGEVYKVLETQWLPAVIGVLVLVITWVPLPKVSGGGQASIVLLGFYQTGLGMLAGATGPVGAAVLLQRNDERDWLVVNTALYMCLNHAIRVGAFVLIGFSFAPWWQLLLGMVLASIAGSYAGTRLRKYVPQVNFARLFSIMVTLLALRMILYAVLSID